VMRVRRQTIGEVDAPAIEELAAGRDSDEHRRVTVLSDTDGRGSLPSSSRHVFLLRGPTPAADAVAHIPFYFFSFAGAAPRGGAALIVAPSQCSSALPFFIRHISNQVLVYFLPGVLGSSYSRTIATTTMSPSAVTDTTFVAQLFLSGIGFCGRPAKNLSTGSSPDATLGLC